MGIAHPRKRTDPVKVDDVLMYLWSNGYAKPEDMINLGYDVVSIPDGYVYIVPAAGYYYDYLNAPMLYNEWTPPMSVATPSTKTIPSSRVASLPCGTTTPTTASPSATYTIAPWPPSP